MAHVTPNGRAGRVRTISPVVFFTVFFIFSFSVFGQTCTVGSTAPAVHAEGLTEQIGDIGMLCTGGTVGSPASSFVQIQIPATITNRQDPSSGLLLGVTITSPDAVLSFDTPALTGPGTLFISPIQYTVPGGQVRITISGIRVAIAPLAGTPNALLYASVIAPSFGITNNTALPVARPVPTLLSSVVNFGVPCAGSPLPTSPNTINFPNMNAAGTSVSTIRITEASAGIFTPRAGAADFGLRFLVSLSGYGPNAQVFVPDVIVGSGGTIPTTSGAFQTIANGGTYTPVPGVHQLLMSRVDGANATGAGGTLFQGIPGGITNYTSVTQVTMVNGAGFVTYEVLDSNPNFTNSAQIPVFVGAPATSCSIVQANTLGATLAPASTVAVPTATDPIPRYIATAPASDCTVSGDCTASYFPVLLAAPASISLSSSSLGQPKIASITVTNGGTSQLTFTATTTYQTATNQSVANWLSINGTTGSPVIGIVDPSAGINSSGLILSASPAALTIPGTYQATVTINAGSAGTTAIPVTFTVGPAGPVIQSVVNAANSQPGPITAGSFAAIYGLNLVPKTTTPATVTVNGAPATISYDGQPSPSSPTQINILIPAGLAGTSTVAVTATVDGVASNNFPVTLVANAPAVFNPGILNQPTAANPGGSVNLASAPASLNDIIQIFLTGLSTTATPPVTVNIGNQSMTGTQIIYAGAVPSVPGLEQVNVQVPTTLTFAGNSAPLTICVPGTGSQPICSAPVNLYLH